LAEENKQLREGRGGRGSNAAGGPGRVRSCAASGGARVARIRPGRCAGRWIGSLGVCVSVPLFPLGAMRGPVFGRWSSPYAPPPWTVQPSRKRISSATRKDGLEQVPLCWCALVDFRTTLLWSVNDTPHYEFCGSFLRPGRVPGSMMDFLLQMVRWIRRGSRMV